MNRQCMASDARRRRGPLPPLSLRKSTLWEMSHQVWGEAHILSLGSAIDETRYALQLPSSLYSHEAKRNKSFLIYSQPNLQKKIIFFQVELFGWRRRIAHRLVRFFSFFYFNSTALNQKPNVSTCVFIRGQTRMLGWKPLFIHFQTIQGILLDNLIIGNQVIICVTCIVTCVCFTYYGTIFWLN